MEIVRHIPNCRSSIGDLARGSEIMLAYPDDRFAWIAGVTSVPGLPGWCKPSEPPQATEPTEVGPRGAEPSHERTSPLRASVLPHLEISGRGPLRFGIWGDVWGRSPEVGRSRVGENRLPPPVEGRPKPLTRVGEKRLPPNDHQRALLLTARGITPRILLSPPGGSGPGQGEARPG